MNDLDNIKWLDGKPATDCFILELHFVNNGLNYMKQADYETMVAWYDFFWRSNPEIVGMVLYDLKRRVIASKNRMAVAV